MVDDPEQIVAALAVACTVNGRPTDKPKLAEEVHPKLSVAVTVYVLELTNGPAIGLTIEALLKPAVGDQL